MHNSWEGESKRAQPLRSMCLLTTTSAFFLGLLVGFAIPLYVLPPLTTTIPPPFPEQQEQVAEVKNASSEPPKKNATQPPAVPQAFQSVTFLMRVAAPKKPPTTPPPEDIWRNDSAAAKNASDLPGDAGLLDGCYWGRDVENALPHGFGAAEDKEWRAYVRDAVAVRLEEGCGRMQNRRVVFADGTPCCCRYRQNTDQIQGEIFSFYLGRLLGLRNLVPSVLSLVRYRAPQWERVQPHMSLAQWHDERTVVLTRNVSQLEAAYIPACLRPYNRRLHPRDVPSREGGLQQLVDLAQWTDLVLFDYLTANLDRVVNNLFNHQWNPGMMDAPTHNLARRPTDGLLVFFDNESGLLHGYRLLDKYEKYHASLLQALCVFRRSTAEVIKSLRRERSAGRLLHQSFASCDPQLADFLPSIPDKSVKILNERIDRVYDQLMLCEREYPPRDKGPP